MEPEEELAVGGPPHHGAGAGGLEAAAAGGVGHELGLGPGAAAVAAVGVAGVAAAGAVDAVERAVAQDRALDLLLAPDATGLEFGFGVPALPGPGLPLVPDLHELPLDVAATGFGTRVPGFKGKVQYG